MFQHRTRIIQIVFMIATTTTTFVACFHVRPFLSINKNGRSSTSKSSLRMAKGFNKARNKQAELAKKMALAKKQQQQSTKQDDDESNAVTIISDATTLKDDQDRKRFQKLLDTTRGALPKDTDTDSAYIAPIKAGQTKIKQKKKKQPPPKPKKKDPEKRKVAQRIHFETLIDLETGKELGNIAAAQLVPWVPPYLNDYLVVFADPRPSSGDLRQTIKYLSSACANLNDKDTKKQQKISNQVICLTADSVAETQAWLTRNKISPSVRIFSDPNLTWMNQYNVLASEDQEDVQFPWSMSSITFDTSGDIIQRNRKVDPSHSTQLVLDTIFEKGNEK